LKDGDRKGDEFINSHSCRELLAPGAQREFFGMLTAIRPPLFDSPATRGLWDPKSQVYFSADSFGACVPHVCEDIDDIDAETFEHGFNWFNRANHPWHEYVDLEKFLPLVERIRRLHSKVIVSYHAPAARNRSEQLCRMISAIPAMERLSLPQQDDLEAMLAAS
jgi:hypothetical protein